MEKPNISTPSQTNLPPKPEVTPSFSSPAPKFSPPLIATFVLLLAFVGVISFFLGKSLSQPKTSPPPISQVSPTPTPENPIPTPTPDPTANWKTYTNNELSFKYPPSWTAETHRIIANNPNIVIYIVAGDSTLMNECMKLEKIEKKDNLVIKKFAGITAGEMCSTNDVNSREIWIIPSENAYSPGISYNYSTKDNPQAEDLFDLILSTFKFLD